MFPPPPLNPGDCIGVFAPSSYVVQEDIEKSKVLLENKGYSVFVHPQTYARHGQMAGTDEEKISALYDLWEREDIKAIWSAGGGNRALNLLGKINFERLKAAPKPLIGFSDICPLLNAITAHTSLTTYHGPVFKALHSYEEHMIDQCLGTLAGKPQVIDLNPAEISREGTATGPLIGGCLSLFQYLVGTKDCPPLDGALLFLEDTGDHISRFDRMFAHLARHRVFERISGLILGEFHDLQNSARPFGFTLEECITEYTNHLNIPIVTNVPFGHGTQLPTFPIGQSATLDTKLLTLSF